MKKNLTNRYIDDTTSRVQSILRRAASYKDYVALFDNMYNNVRLSALYKPESTYLMHNFTCLWIIQGQALLTINGKEQLLDRKAITIIPPQAAFKLQQVSPETRFSFIRFSEEAIVQSYKDLGLYMNRFFLTSYNCTTLSNEAFRELTDMYNDFCEGLEHHELQYLNIYARSYCNLIMVFLFNTFDIDTNIKGKAVSRQENIYRQFIDLLNLYADREREVQFYADQLGISPKYLSAITQTYSGKNASEWIADYVVELAIGLMREKKCKIREISAILNFPTQSFFGRFFKRTTGLSPKRYTMIHFDNE
jgi:AraC-like DNA-binding protein/mannose-6-phosphate isomerase-like protein (cupin superfamily)